MNFQTILNKHIITKFMKRKIRIILVSIFLLTSPLLIFAQIPPHPNGGAAPNSGSNAPVGGGAPIGGGLALLFAMGIAYGASKLYQKKSANSVSE
jgi:hypothetical protein